MYLGFADCTIDNFHSSSTFPFPPTAFAISACQIAPDVELGSENLFDCSLNQYVAAAASSVAATGWAASLAF